PQVVIRGGWEKFVYSGQDSNYLPHWLKSAGYRTECIGKLMNGYNMATYKPKPKGWDHTDLLLNPYTYEFNNVVMSLNGERPVFYNGYHQTDVIRVKAAVFSTYVVFQQCHGSTNPQFRINPADEFQAQKPSWLAELPRLNGSQVDFIEWSYRSRLQSLLGVDELVEDVVELLREQERLDDTYVIYTTDNGYHVGNHRQIGGKGLPYIEDTNIPMIIRGPGIEGGTVSKTPSTHIDLAPTYLDIAGLEASLRPSFLDGRSLINEWIGSVDKETNETKRVAKEIINIEFWGTISNGGLPDFEQRSEVYAYKTLRIVGEDSGWLFSRWCEANTTELYNTLLTNLAINPSAEHRRLMDRLNAVLLVTKSCNQESCRDPWQILRDDSGDDFMNLEQAMDPKFDTFFAALPSVRYKECLDYQDTSNEGPYYPPESIVLASQHRLSTENYPINVPKAVLTPGNVGRMGSTEHRYVSLETIMEMARNVTDEEIGNVTVCAAPLYCNQKGGD
ncbi:arylsulfatase precursor, partial [Fusarium albosuccineum]